MDAQESQVTGDTEIRQPPGKLQFSMMVDDKPMTWDDYQKLIEAQTQ